MLLILVLSLLGLFPSSNFALEDVLENSQFEVKDELLEKMVRTFKLEYHRNLETERIRRKRDAGFMLSMTVPQDNRRERLSVGLPREDFYIPLSDFSVSCWTWIQPDPDSQNLLILLITDDGHFVLFNYDSQRFNVLLKLVVEDVAYKAQVFVSGPFVWFVVAFRSRENGRHYVQLYRYNGLKVHRKQAIRLDGKADFALVYNRGYWYMATATLNKLTLYQWQETQYDEVATNPVVGINSLAIWRASGVIYIATAAGVDGVGSPLFQYKRSGGGQLSRLQILPVHSSSKVVKFKVDGNDYLLFLCRDFAVIYWRSGDAFLEYQVISDSAGAIDADVLLLPDLEVAIAIAFKSEIRLYAESFTSEYTVSYSRVLGVELTSGFGFFYQANLNYFLLLTYNLSNWDLVAEAHGGNLPQNVWILNVTKYYDMQPYEDPLTSCIESLRTKLDINSQTLEFIQSNYESVWVTNKEQRIQSPVIILGRVEVKEGLKVEHVLLQSPEDIPVVPQITNSILRDEITQQDQNLNTVVEDMNNLVYSTKDQVINGNLVFILPIVTVSLQLTSLVNDVVLNHVPLSVLAENVLKTHGEQTIWHSLHITHVETKDLYLHGTINGLKPQDAVLLNQDEHIESYLHFTNVRVQDISLNAGGAVNGLQLSLFVTTNQPQIITGTKVFNNLIVQKDLVVQGQTNQRDLSVFVQNVLRLDNPTPNFLDEVEFSAPIHVEGDAFVDGLVNGIVDLKDLATRALYLSTDQIITGKKTFGAPVFVNGDVLVDGATNGVDVSEVVLTLSTDQHIPGTVSFTTFEILGDLSTGTVNGYDLKTEVVTRENQTGFAINGHKTFEQSVQVMHDVNIRDGSLMNGLDLSDLVHAATRTDNVVVLGPTSFQSLVIQQVIASDSINGISFDSLLNNVWRKSTNQDIFLPVQFSQSVSMEHDLKITRNMNGYDLTEDFVHVTGDEEISGYVHFMDTVYIQGSLDIAPGKTINDIDISEYNITMVPSQKDSVIHSHVIFSSLEVKGNLIISGTVNGERLDELLQVNKQQVFTGHVTLASNHTTVFGDLKLDSLFLERDINGVDFSEFNKHVVYGHETGNVITHKDFVGGLVAESVLSYGTLSGFDVDDWFLNAVRLSTDGDISGFKMLSVVEFLGGLTIDTLNDVSLSDHLSSIVMDTVDHIRGPKTIKGSVSVNGELITKGLLNDVNLQQVEFGAAYVDADNSFTGLVTIDGNLEVDSLMMGESTTLDGLLWNHLIFLDQNHALHGTTIFPEGVTTTDATVRRLINGCDIVELSEQAIYLGEPFPALGGTVAFRTLTVHGNMDVSGLTGAVNLTSLAEMMLRKNGLQRLTNIVQFTALQADSVRLKDINGIDFLALMQDAVVKSQTQTISGVKKYVHVDGVTFLNNLVVQGNVETEGRINGVDLSLLYEMSVFKSIGQEIRGLKTFSEVEVRGNVYIDGLINGVSVPSELILLETNEEISLPITFKSETSVIGQVYIGRHLDGVNFQQFVRDRVTLLKNQEIHAEIEFQDTLETDNLEVLGSVNDVPISDIVLRPGAVHLSSQKTFENSVTIAGPLTVHQLNHVDLTQFSRDLVRINKPEEISHIVDFVSEIEVQNDLVIQESINDIKLAGLEQEFADYNVGLRVALETLRENTRILDVNIQLSQEQLLAGQFWELLHFQPFQTVEMKLTRIFPSPSQDIELDAKTKAGVTRRLLGWSSSCDMKGCCHSAATHVFDLDESGHAASSITQPGRLFSLFTEVPIAEGNLHGFVLWTNTTTHSQMCSGTKSEVMSITSIWNDGLPDFSDLLRPKPSPTVQNVKLFRADNDLHLVITYVPNSFNKNQTSPSVLRYSQDSNTWLLLQLLVGAERSTSLDLVQYTDRTTRKHLLMALTTHLSVLVYRWSDRKQFDLVTKMPAPGVSTSSWIEVEGTLLLMLAMPDAQLLNVYSYLPETVDGSHLAWLQSLEISGINVLHEFYLSGETFVAVASRTTQDLSILQMRGHKGFTLIQRHPIPGITDVTSYWSTDGNLFLAVASDCGLVILKAVAFGFGSRY